MPQRPKRFLFTQDFLAAQLAIYRHFLPHFIPSWLQNPAYNRFGLGVIHRYPWDYSTSGQHALGLSLFDMLAHYRQQSILNKQPIKPVQFAFGFDQDGESSRRVQQLALERNESQPLGQLRQFSLVDNLIELRQATLARSANSRALYLFSLPEFSLLPSLIAAENWLGVQQDALFVLPAAVLKAETGKLSKHENQVVIQIRKWLGIEFSDEGGWHLPGSAYLLSAAMPEDSLWPHYHLMLLTRDVGIGERFLLSTQQARASGKAVGNQVALFSTSSPALESPSRLALEQLLDSQAEWNNKSLYEALLKAGWVPQQAQNYLFDLTNQLQFRLVDKKNKLTALPKGFAWKLSLSDYRLPSLAYTLHKENPA